MCSGRRVKSHRNKNIDLTDILVGSREAAKAKSRNENLRGWHLWDTLEIFNDNCNRGGT